ncbi:glyoxylate/hydroxypyruvate reductase HPR3 isoform X1 [Cinnamomum micranthum f. kanehirae]|uniref:Glyoxylate/hydroxypyruvate reductase HPR3 isoform X1 n=1 Tax=Cinnamomum micranthum f. kanehirae TaxID=337451 RepID=A0A3S3P2C9_9MAGN|nr:glyoxylate/hydroxypyruvate reductase HPR3 isoform X1 [Cinnamomum micranthum f. kanehirae]
MTANSISSSMAAVAAQGIGKVAGKEKGEDMPLVLLLRPLNFFLDERLSKRFRLLRPWESPLPRDQFLAAHARSVRAILCVGLAPVNAEILESLPCLGCVVTTSAGVDHIDLPECRRRGVAVANAGNVFSEDAADCAVGLLLDVLRRISASDRYVRSGLWSSRGDYPLLAAATATEKGLERVEEDEQVDLPIVLLLKPLKPFIDEGISKKFRLLKPWESPLPRDQLLAAHASSVRVILSSGRGPVEGEILDRLPHVGCVLTTSAGYDHIDVPECRRRGVVVANSGAAYAVNVADYAIGLLIDVHRRISASDRYVRGGLWSAKGDFPLLEAQVERPTNSILLLFPILPLFEEALSRKYHVLRAWESSMPTPEFLAAYARDVRVLVCSGLTPVDSATLQRLPGLECVVSTSAGVDHIDLAECRRRGIAVTNAGDAFSQDVADYAVGLLLDGLRRISASDRYVRSGQWSTQGQLLGLKGPAAATATEEGLKRVEEDEQVDLPIVLVLKPLRPFMDEGISKKFRLLKPWESPLPRDQFLAAHSSSVRVILSSGRGPVDGEILDSLPHVGCVLTTSAGYDHIDIAECRRRGVVVANSGAAYAVNVADYAIGLLIDVHRRISASDRYVRGGLWSARGDFPILDEQVDLPIVLLLKPLKPFIDEGLSNKFRLLKPWESPLPRDQFLAAHASSVRVILSTGLGPVDGKILNSLPHVECVLTTSAGYDHIDIPECRRRGVAVANSGAAYAVNVADYAMGLLIDVHRRISASDRYVRGGLWSAKGDFPLLEAQVERPTNSILLLFPILPFFEEALSRKYHVLRAWESSMPTPEFLAAYARDVRVLVCSGLTPVDSATLQRLPGLECVVSTSAGVDHIDLAECRRRGIAVTNAGDAFSQDVADFAVGLLLDGLRRISASDRYVRSGQWSTQGQILGLKGRKLSGKRVGIVGLGSIGSEIAKRLEAFGCRIAYNSRTKKASVPFPYFSSVHDLAAESDALIVCCALTDETYHFINRDVLLALGKEGVVINVGRGALIDEKELVRCLVQGEIGGAGLDVFEEEPHVPQELITMDNVVLSPHRAVLTPESFTALLEVIVGNLEAFFANKPLLSPV